MKAVLSDVCAQTCILEFVFALCLCEMLCISVVSFCSDIFTTEAQRSHGDTEKQKRRQVGALQITFAVAAPLGEY